MKNNEGASVSTLVDATRQKDALTANLYLKEQEQKIWY